MNATNLFSPLINATDLFSLPHRKFHSSESFWSSLFAVQVLDASRRRESLRIPVFVYRETLKRWWFEPSEPLVAPGGLSFESAIVEGGLGTGFISSVSATLPPDFDNLKPDIVLQWGNTVSVIETKTSHVLSEKETQYVELSKWLTANGCAAEAYLLLSAGHYQRRMLANEAWGGPRKLILWEKFFEAVEVQLANSLISGLIPDLNWYYTPDDGYMGGNFA